MKSKPKILAKAQREINERFVIAIFEVIGTPRNGIETIADFCKKTKITPQAVTYCRKHERCFSMEDILKLHKVYGYSPNWILLGIGNKKT